MALTQDIKSTDFWQSNKYAKSVHDTIEAASGELRELSLKIHDSPEVGLHEFKAHAWLTKYLTEKGFAVEQGDSQLETAFVARAGNESGVTIGIVSEYDALPGIGHGCGHNLIAISGVATALALKVLIEKFDLPAQIKLFGTPSEERDSGKITMLDAGDFKGVDVCMMLHASIGDALYAPFLSLNSVEVEFFGKASHASTTPWEGINALDAAMEVYTNIGLLRQQVKPDHRLHGIIVNGGQAPNIIPEYTKSLYMFRAPKYAQVIELKAKLVKIFESAANSTGCTLNLKWGSFVKDVLVNEHLASKFEQVMGKLGLKYASKADQESKPAGSTDMGNLTYAIPGIHPMFNIMNLDGVIDYGLSLHTKEFAAAASKPLGHTATLRASKALAMTAVECILDPEFLQLVKEEFAKTSL
ncbi:hypothetical protein BGZ49_005376 [Haplosporangium sp. Z 27]|nr:hypothetical protein BGZ49_005376 [Haplosporangium sp. Z 27]